MYQKSVAVRKATYEMTKKFEKYHVSSALRTRNGPGMSDIHSAPIGSNVLVYIPEKDCWEGPHFPLNYEGEKCTVLLSSGATKFRSTFVKRYVSESSSNGTEESSTNGSSDSTILQEFMIKSSECEVLEVDEPSEIMSCRNICQSQDTIKFKDSRLKEMDGLLSRSVFTPVQKSGADG